MYTVASGRSSVDALPVFTVNALRSAFVGYGRLAVAVVSFLRFLVWRVALGLLSVAAVSCLCLVVRVRHTSTALLNYLCFKAAGEMSLKVRN